MSIFSPLTSYGFNIQNLLAIVGGVLGTTALVHVLPYIIDKYGIRRYPGPLLARFSTAWLASVAFRGRIIVAVHDLHQRHGVYYRLYNIHSNSRADNIHL